MPKSRPENDYGLPPLTLEEAARVLGIPRAEFSAWLDEVVKPSDQQVSMWTRGKRSLPEALIRLYLVQHPRVEQPAPPTPRYSVEEFQALMAERKRRRELEDEEARRAVVPPLPAAATEKKRAAGGKR